MHHFFQNISDHFFLAGKWKIRKLHLSLENKSKEAFVCKEYDGCIHVHTYTHTHNVLTCPVCTVTDRMCVSVLVSYIWC